MFDQAYAIFSPHLTLAFHIYKYNIYFRTRPDAWSLVLALIAVLFCTSPKQVHSPPFQDLQQHFFDGDSGIQLCSYPNGVLGGTLNYMNIVGSGFTYPFLAGLVFDGNLEDAMMVASNIRQRQDGRNMNPWDEPECDHLYSRAMAGWNVFDQACGFQ